jgi:hypothetical protein
MLATQGEKLSRKCLRHGAQSISIAADNYTSPLGASQTTGPDLWASIASASRIARAQPNP